MDGLSAHTSVVVWRSLSARGTKLLCIPVVRQQIQQIQTGDFLQNLPGPAQAPHLSGSIQISQQITQIDCLETFLDRLRRNYWPTLEFVCLPHLSSWWATVGRSLTFCGANRNWFSLQLWGWKLGFTPSSTKYFPFPSEASPGFQLRSSSIPSICSTKTNQQLLGFIKEQTLPKPLPLGSCEIMYSEQPMAHRHFHHARLNTITKMWCKIHIQYVRTSTWTNPN